MTKAQKIIVIAKTTAMDGGSAENLLSSRAKRGDLMPQILNTQQQQEIASQLTSPCS